jgi:hypothetical protein
LEERTAAAGEKPFERHGNPERGGETGRSRLVEARSKTSRGQPKPEGVSKQKVGKLCEHGGCASVMTAKRDETLGR